MPPIQTLSDGHVGGSFPLIIDIRQLTPTKTACSNSTENRCLTNEEEGSTEAGSREWSPKTDDASEAGVESSSLSYVIKDGMSESGYDLTKQIIKGLTPKNGEIKKIPTVVLYDDKGLQIYDEITLLEEYYLVQEETDILHAHSDSIVELIPNDSIVVELGSGSLRKTSVLLDALERKRRNIHYYALDLMKDELTKSLLSLGGYKNVKTAGLWGTYDEGMAFISSFPSGIPKTILWLGSSIGNLSRAEAKSFITAYRDILNVGDNWLIGIDRRNSPKDITLAYNDPTSVTREFILNGLDHINSILRQPLFDRTKFDYYGQYNEELGRHEAYYQSLENQKLFYQEKDGAVEIEINIKREELINVEYSYKWSLEESAQLFEDTKMAKIGQWASPTERYDLHMLKKLQFYFSSIRGESTLSATPSIEEWEELWKAWNFVTMEMVKKPEMLMETPIDLRHPFLFYIGHIPAFLDIQLSKVLNEPYTSPEYFTEIFERGIDPDVEDPSKCHEHSKVPESWPELSDIIIYRDAVHARLIEVFHNKPLTRRLGRVLFMGFEHQAMHLETLLYMMVQSSNTLPPTHVSFPTLNASRMNHFITQADWIKINPKELDNEYTSLGHEDDESKDHENKSDLSTPFGWDNESPRVEPFVGNFQPFAIQSRQATNGEYLKFVDENDTEIPKSWIKGENSEFSVKTVFGPVLFDIARDWPVVCSQKEATKYIDWMNCSENKSYSLPTEHQLSIAFKLKQKKTKTFTSCNYGFKNWYPCASKPKTYNEDYDWSRFQGPGPLWDWTCTEFGPLNNAFRPSELYPGYSADFFDEKHFVMLGASWATHPRIAERRSFRNWYQATYPYMFAGFRLVCEMKPLK